MDSRTPLLQKEIPQPGGYTLESESSRSNEIQSAPPETGLTPFLRKMGDLPEYKFGGSLLRGRTLNYAIGCIASCGFLMFGYDQGVLSALLTLDSFQQSIPLMTPRERKNPLCWLDADSTIPDLTQCTGDANTQAAAVAIYQIGCFFGSILILFYGEDWGRKSSTFWGSLIIIIGTALQAAAHEYGMFVAGRIVGGIGNGMVTSSMLLSLILSGSVLKWLTSQKQRSRHGRVNVRVHTYEDYSLCFPVPSYLEGL